MSVGRNTGRVSRQTLSGRLRSGGRSGAAYGRTAGQQDEGEQRPIDDAVRSMDSAAARFKQMSAVTAAAVAVAVVAVGYGLWQAGASRAAVDQATKGARSVVVTTRDVASDVQVQASKSLMDLAIGNLLRNAIMHNISSGTLDIAARQEHCAIIVTITNSTDETLPDDLMNLKQPFHRGEHSRISAEPGVGLGLSIADAACEAMGATLELDRPGAQSVRATLPIASA